MKLEEILTSHRIPFERLHHRPAYTANRVAQLLHVPGKEMAKTVLLRADDRYVLAVVPASYQIDMEQFRQRFGAQKVNLASETEMDGLFPDCERGAIPPFGSLYNLQTVVEDALAEDDQIVFEAQDHENAIRMTFRDYEAMEHPARGHFGHHI
jgi:Ala-tRNA(Pro) deacylase